MISWSGVSGKSGVGVGWIFRSISSLGESWSLGKLVLFGVGLDLNEFWKGNGCFV